MTKGLWSDLEWGGGCFLSRVALPEVTKVTICMLPLGARATAAVPTTLASTTVELQSKTHCVANVWMASVKSSVCVLSAMLAHAHWQ